MALSRRAALTALGCGALAACTPPTQAELQGPGGRALLPPAAPLPTDVQQTSTSLAGSEPPEPSSVAPSTTTTSVEPQARPVLDRQAVIARYSAMRPTAWGLDIPGVTTRLPTSDRVVALTFDACGGAHGSGVDQALIAVLRQHQVPATLFLNARWIEANRRTFDDLAADPLFEIGNHGTQHRPLSVTGRSAYRIPGTRSAAEVYDEVAGNRDNLATLLGRRPLFFRTGTAFCDDVALRITGDLDQRMVNFDVNGDAGATRPARDVDRALRSARPGSIVICHMNQPGSGTSGGVSSAVPALVAGGFRFVHLSDYLH